LKLAAPEETQLGEIAGFISKSERERLRLIREARAIYDSIFPPTEAVSERPHDTPGKGDTTGLKGSAASKGNVWVMGRS
jgi:hypothetical protein